MAKRRIMLTLPGELHSEPIIYTLGLQFNLLITIRQADLTKDRGWVVLELEGADKDIEAGITWATSKGVRVDFVNEQ